MRYRFACLAVLIALALSTLSFAQKIAGTITGTVSDPQGAVVPGATVIVTDEATNATRTTTTKSAGEFTVPNLDPGTYSVKVSGSGFSDFEAKRVEVHVSSITRVDAKLQVGTTKQEIVVEAQGIELNTENGEVGNVITGAQVRELPLNGRNFVQLTTIMPGASVSEGFDNKSKGLMGGVDISFSGAPSNANQWRVDGANNNDIGSQRTILMYPSIDGIEEFKILRNSYGPEYGGGGGAQVNVVTKGGGNEYHGDAYYFGRNGVLNAKNYFIGLNTCTSGSDPACQKQALQRNDFGYTLGGPIVKDRVFFFWSEEWNYERRGAVRHDWVPTAQERATGDFSDIASCPAGSKGPAAPNFAKYNTTGDTVGSGTNGQIMDPGHLSPAGQALVSMMPLPTASPCNQYDWIAQVKVPLNWREENIRGDIKITKNNNLMLRYAQDSWDNPLHASANGEAGLWGTQDFPAVSDAWSQPSKMAVARLTTTIGTTMVNDFQFSYSANRINIVKAGDDTALGNSIRAAVPTVYPLSGKLHSSDLPMPICWCSTYFGTQGPWNNNQDLYTWRDDFSKVAGKHTLKLGILYDQNSKNEEQGGEAGGLWGSAGYNKVSWDGGSGNFYGDMLLKNMSWGGGENAKNVIADIRWRDVEFYAGDTWKVTPRFTLDYGFRWSFMPPEWMDKNDWSIFNPAVYDPTKGADPCNGVELPKGGDTSLCAGLGSSITPAVSQYRSLRPSNNHLIQPRLGFAYDVFGTGKFVLRAGIGQFFARDPVGLTLRSKSVNPPFAAAASGYRTLDGFGPNNTPTTWDNGGAVNAWPTGGTPTQSFEQNSNLSNSWQWNITTEAMLTKDTKLELAWVALRGIHLGSAADINQIAPDNRLAYIERGLANSGDTRTDLFPYGGLTTGQITQWNHRGDSIYHSLQAMLSTKLTRNSILQSSYTWSHNISTTTLGYVGTSTAVPDSYNSAANRGNADFDRRHVFNLSLVYNSPALQGHNMFVKGVAGGWELGSILNFSSGPAITVNGLSVSNLCPSQAQLADCNAGTVPLIGVNNPWGVSNAGQYGARPSVVSNVACNTGSSSQWLNQSAFTANGFPLGGYPNSGPGQCAGPGTANADVSAMKNWNLPIHGKHFFTEGAHLQFRFELFNLANHPMFRFNNNHLTYTATGYANGATSGPVNGYIADDGTIQGTSLVQGSTLGQPGFLNNIGNREIQYALKFIF
ncbi:Cna B-type protein [Candidatus Koribacter versatilis Ellin345]|uniref:Cna B-type protein n=1 Tax=Koribacter versatilis (strain Ellin345) TaxID=204669 RepID=Q1IT87_KORVE|nr:carboxypeptidase-like regulatory domain-containing protein [Candidatus Koribacter versatilis]ABF39913.1 Cna B-type protein [Candidatus Koribacter versatilis Ellin345]